MIEKATCETFAECGAREYRVKLEEGEGLTLELAQASPIDLPSKGGAREQFSLLFNGPVEPVLPQAIYTLENEELGTFEIFLVPVAADEEGVDYEAVFA
jgi:hypothetical protein